MRKELGAKGEKLAARYLKKNGYRVLDMNVREVGCEIDIIAQDKTDIVFVEVKTRTSSVMGYPEESVTDQKKAHIARAAESWLIKHTFEDVPWRVDVVAIVVEGGKSPEIRHFIGV